MKRSFRLREPLDLIEWRNPDLPEVTYVELTAAEFRAEFPIDDTSPAPLEVVAGGGVGVGN